MSIYIFMFATIFDALRDLVPFVQFKKHKNTHRGALLLVKLQDVQLLQQAVLHGCFSCFLKLYKWYQNAQHTTDI